MPSLSAWLIFWRAIAILGVLFCGLAIATKAFAWQLAAHEDPVRSITVALDNNYPPYSFRDDKGVLQGIAVDVWTLWSRKTGIPVLLEGMNGSEAQIAVLNGKADVIETFFLTERSSPLYDFSKPYGFIDVVVFFHNSVAGIADAQSLRGFSVGVKAKGACSEWLNRNGITNLRPFASYPDIVSAAQTGDVKIFCMNTASGLFYLNKADVQREFNYTAPLFSAGVRWAVAKGNTATFDTVMAGFKQISPDEHSAILAKWMGQVPSAFVTRDIVRILAYVAGGVSLLILFLALWNRALRSRVDAKTSEVVSAMAALKDSQQHFEALVTTTPSGVFETDADDTLIYVTHRWLEITGLAVDAVKGTRFSDLIHADDRPTFLAEWNRATDEKRQFRVEQCITKQDKRIAWVLIQAAPRKGADGAVVGHIGAMIDISERKIAELALKESEQRFKALYREAPLPYQSLSVPEAVIVDVNDAWLENFGYSRDEVEGRWMGEFLTADGKAALREMYPRFITKGDIAGPHLEFMHKDGSLRLVTVNGRIGYDPQGKALQTHCILVDITKRISMENTLRILTMAVQQSPVAIVITNVNGVIEYVNPAFTVNSGYSLEEAVGLRPNVLKGGETSPEEYHALWKRITSGEPWHGTFHNKRKDGSFFWEDAVVAPVRDSTGSITHYIGIKQDITARREAEARVAFLAHHDALTKLPNRLLGKDRMEWAIAHADRTKCKAALAFLDLDHFKRVNDTLGHSVGDALLRAVAERLRECVRETDTISRQGGDEFLIVLSDIDDPETVARVATKILRRLAPAFHVADQDLATTLSIGIAVYPDDGNDFDSLLRHADTAMYHAKEAGRNTYRFFTEQMNIDASEYLSIRSTLQAAIDRHEFVLHYQPQISLATGEVTGVEALIRWNHPDLGLVPPGRFIAIAEESGLIVPIGDWVLKEACRQAVAWHDLGLPRLLMAVNLSGVQFKRGDLMRSVTTALAESGLEPHYLELELTESILIKDTDNVLSTVEELKALGVQLSIDDFGTGYSSLAYLKKFHVDKVKIDQSFVRDITTDANDDAIVRAIVQMARSLGLKTIAEGVEDSETLAAVKRHQCDEVQGYHFARPMAADQLPVFLASRRLALPAS